MQTPSAVAPSAAVHTSHAPEHAALQHTLSEQKPDEH